MRRLAEGLGYGALALGLHLAAFAALAPALGGMQAAGAGGEDRVTLAPASAQIAALVQDWTRAPEVREAAPPPPPPAPAEAEAATPAAPASETAPQAPQHAPPLRLPPAATPEVVVVAQSAPRPPLPPRARPPQAPRPAATPHKTPSRPARHRAQQDRAAAPALRAKGQGGGATAGAGGQAPVSTPGGSSAAALQRAWGAEIAALIARQKRYPEAADGAVGKVGVTLQVTAAGALAAVRVTRSSGNAALDRAALEAARRAAPFPPAPGGGAGPFGFSFTMDFRR